MIGAEALAAARSAMSGGTTMLVHGAMPPAFVAEVRHARDGLVLVLADSAMPDLDRAMLLVAIGPLAVERAPDVRVCALNIMPGAVAADVSAAARFLAGARSVTGQIVMIAPDQPAVVRSHGPSDSMTNR